MPGNTDIVQAIDNLRIKGFAGTLGSVTTAVKVNGVFTFAGPSASGTIPKGCLGFVFQLISGTGTLGGAAMPLGLALGSTNIPNADIAWTTGSASSAFIYYETAA